MAECEWAFYTDSILNSIFTRFFNSWLHMSGPDRFLDWNLQPIFSFDFIWHIFKVNPQKKKPKRFKVLRFLAFCVHKTFALSVLSFQMHIGVSYIWNPCMPCISANVSTRVYRLICRLMETQSGSYQWGLGQLPSLAATLPSAHCQLNGEKWKPRLWDIAKWLKAP